MKRRTSVWIVGSLLLAGLAYPAVAGMTLYEKDDKRLEVGGRIQVQYHLFDPDDAESEDDLYMRRLRFYLEGTASRNWVGKMALEFGRTIDADEVTIKDAYIAYTGWGDDLTLFVGHTKTVYSREFQNPSTHQYFAERSFAGGRAFGRPDRMLGLRLDGLAADRTLRYQVNFGAEKHAPDADVMVFGSTLVQDADDWNEGWIGAARIDVMPLGYVPLDETDFRTERFRLLVGASAYAWENDGDVNDYTDGSGRAIGQSFADLDRARGYAVTAGVRGHGLSVDGHYRQVRGETVDPTFTGGLYVGGRTDLEVATLQGGYLLPGDRFELVAGWTSVDADGYAVAWTRSSLGLNYYWNRHNLQLQTSFERWADAGGVRGDDANVLFVQMQFVF